MTITCGRLQQVAFTTVYYEDGQKILVDRLSGIHGPDDLAGRRTCAAKGTTSIPEIDRLPPHPIPIGVDNWTDCLVMLQQRQVDAVSTDAGVLAGLAAQDPTSRSSVRPAP